MDYFDYDKITSVLTERFPHIKITDGPAGTLPVQAFGTFGEDEFFYFRFRNTWGSLTVGPHDEIISRLYAQRVTEDNITRKKENPEWVGSGTESWGRILAKKTPNSGSSRGYIPLIVSKTASQEGLNPEEHYKGDLDTDEFIELFTRLVNNLEEIPLEKQLSDFMRIWLFEGRAAVTAWQDKNFSTK